MRMVRSRLAVTLGLVLATLGCDHATKRVAVAALKGEPARSFLGGAVRLQYAENAGAFLGLGAGLPEPARSAVFALGNAVLLLVLVGLLWRSAQLGRRELVALGLLLAGGLSNLLDRLASGGVVVDFLNVGLGGLRTGIFNVADVAITTGALLLLWSSMRPPRVP